MKNILVTGATGNVGYQVIRFLHELSTENRVIAGVRSIKKAKGIFSIFPELEYVEFDFEKPETFSHALNGVDTVFLLRPPQLVDIKIFQPLIDEIKSQGINEVVFLSVQGAERSNIIPHAKIEKLILKHDLDYIFLRPGYFMQNLTTTLLDDIKNKAKIFLPAGKAKFNWIDVENISELAAILLESFSEYKNQAFEVTGYENMDFGEVAEVMTKVLGYEIGYESPNIIRFYFTKRNDGIERGMVLVMIMLHFLPRFGKEPIISDFYEKFTGKKPTKLIEFIEREKNSYCIIS